MCEFCIRHGAGRTWYLDAANYCEDAVRNRRRFRDVLLALVREHEPGDRSLARLQALLRSPVIGPPLRRLAEGQLKRHHFGQVLPLEDVRRVLELVDVIHGFPCICRRHLLGKAHEHYCIGLGAFFKEWAGDMPDLAGEGEPLSAAEAYRRVEEFDRQGLVHTIWTLETPFIIAICNCRPGACVALEMLLKSGTRMMFKGERLFQIDPSRCTGCGMCLETCYFEALRQDAVSKRYTVVPEACYGCGLCRAACPTGAAGPVERPAHLRGPAAF